MIRWFSLEGYSVYYCGEQWLAESELGVEANWGRPMADVVRPHDPLQQDLEWANRMDVEIASRMREGYGYALHQGPPPGPQARAMMRSWGWPLE